MKKSSGSMKDDYQKYLQSTHWQQRRKKAIEDSGNICEKCDLPRWLAQIAYQQDLNVHHLNYASLGHEEDCDLEVLCRRCHDMETFGRSDFRAPKQTKCDICGELHWDIYGGICDVCLALLAIKEPISFRFGSSNPCDNGDPVWKSVLRELILYFHRVPIGVDEVFLEASQTIKRIRNFERKSSGLSDDDIAGF